MKITKSQLKQVIKEELNTLNEGRVKEKWAELQDKGQARQDIVNALAEYFDVTVGEAELMFRKLES